MFHFVAKCCCPSAVATSPRAPRALSVFRLVFSRAVQSVALKCNEGATFTAAPTHGNTCEGLTCLHVASRRLMEFVLSLRVYRFTF